MFKAIAQLCILALVFLAVWFGLRQVPYVKLLHLDHFSKKAEKKIGEKIVEAITTTHKEIKSDSVAKVLDKVKERMCEGNKFQASDLHFHLVNSSEVNAFALPGNHIIIYTGLIAHCDSVEELCGVLAHEIAHLQLHHVMNRLMSELGMAALTAIATNGNSEIMSKVIKTLSVSAFERQQEAQADATGVKYLVNAGISPNGMAGFMLKIADMQSDMPEEMEWISSHPDSRKRAATIMALVPKESTTTIPVLNSSQWQRLVSASR